MSAFLQTLEVWFFSLCVRVAHLLECLQECLRHCQGTECCKFSTYNLSLGHPCYFWLTWKMWVYVMSVCVMSASHLSILGKNFDVAIFLGAIWMMNVKLCALVVLVGLYPFIPLSVTLTFFTCRDYGGRFSASFPSCTFLFFKLRSAFAHQFLFLGQESVHSG